MLSKNDNACLQFVIGPILGTSVRETTRARSSMPMGALSLG